MNRGIKAMRGYITPLRRAEAADRAQRYERVGMALLVTLFFVLGFDLATSAAGLLPEVYLLLLVVYLAFGFAAGWLRPKHALEQMARSPLLSLCAVGYIAADLLSALIAPDWAIVLQKYKVVGGLVAAAGAVLILARTQSRLDTLMLAFGAAASAAAATAFINTIWPVLYPVYYRLRLSPRIDYNMFSTALLVGLVCGGCRLAAGRCGVPYRMRAVCFFALLSLSIPAILLSGSRRTYLLLAPAVLLLCLSCALPGSICRSERVTAGRGTAFMLALAAACAVITYGGRQALGRQNPSAVPHAAGEGGGVSIAETSAEQRYAMINEGGMLDKRLAIYAVAADELLGYKPMERFVGKGLGANILLYDRPDERIQSIYPDSVSLAGKLSAHNMLLADLLDGGVCKAAVLLFLLGATGCSLILLLFRDTQRSLPYLAALAVSVLGALVSGRFGLLYDRYFVLIGAMLIVEMGIKSKGEEGTDAKLPAQA